MPGREFRILGDTNTPKEYANINFWDAERATGRRWFTLFVPDGPTERQITAAVSSKDSFVTGQRFDPFVSFRVIRLPK